eukprot:5592528-Alexandrium_andersonii.AAC.1
MKPEGALSQHTLWAKQPSPRLGIGKSRGSPNRTARRRKHSAKRGASCAWTCRMEASDFQPAPTAKQQM